MDPAERISRFVRVFNEWLRQGQELRSLEPGPVRDDRVFDQMRGAEALAHEGAELAMYLEEVGENCADLLRFCGGLQTFKGMDGASLRLWPGLEVTLCRCAVAHKVKRAAAAGDLEGGKKVATSMGAGQQPTDDDYRPARWFKQQTGIPPSRLRTAASRGALPTKGAGQKKQYSLSKARALWPEDFEGLNTSQA